jgi:hypothetical protein
MIEATILSLSENWLQRFFVLSQYKLDRLGIGISARARDLDRATAKQRNRGRLSIKKDRRQIYPQR